ncbi:glutamine-hydrolyzing GMP synthase [Aliifodinibius sp. S!AR15-10]|uniref:glutamine-hydrolyzing GMP synthase n=1 Tax=Aliifodinibius sp. S!AR15-10 TaxID=2950437 RepID=UPI00285C52C8|nr:glutamine-hydrolyzing GMP synthase [Aliifodinibius sp. S!AR15-10]MDR8391028.1 glutamine-hydrolyzing GMP synthase [Aliifodinibius sp. S!AR15-10]
MHHRPDEWILIIDFGSQYTQLIARRLRELNVYCEIHPCNADLTEFDETVPGGIILSGGPMSVNDEDAPGLNKHIFSWNAPVLGVCYGLQLLAHDAIPGSVEQAERREFGRSELIIDDGTDLLKEIPEESIVWMSHGDHIKELPGEYDIIGHTDNARVAAVRHAQKPIFGVQFHPEVVHTVYGKQILENFAFEICHLHGSWTAESFIESTIKEIREQVGDNRVLCGLSGGVDSTVVATLVHKAIGDQLQCIFVDNGLLRKNEFQDVLDIYEDKLHLPVKGIDASQQFLEKLEGVFDPEKKRKIIGNTFIDVFDDAIKDDNSFRFLAQGTLYPDVIESVSFKGPSATIKSHHNVGGLPEEMNLELVEPVRELFKDEVRNVGRKLGIPDHFIKRHPFPGPGLGIRIISDVTKPKLDLLREADDIFISELRKNDLYDEVWQALAVLLPVQSVGVMGDERTYEFTIGLRAVTSVDGMTADWAKLPHPFLAHVSNRIINEVRGINRVVYDVSSKPPSTIEWE